MHKILYLIPSTIGNDDVQNSLPQETLKILQNIDEFIVENVRSARRFLKKAGYPKSFDNVSFKLLNKHTPEEDYPSFLDNISNEGLIGILSEAGCPCIADPGSKIVAIAHEKGIKVRPLTGPSSIFLALMASGFNGQSFVFHGYLPIEKKQQQKKLKEIEKKAIIDNQTQIFMETPYRNNKLLHNIITSLSSSTLLCIASEITTDKEFIETKSLGEWRNNLPELNKKNTIFIIGKI